VRRNTCGLAESTEESRIKAGYTRNSVIEDRRAVGDGTVSLAQRTTVLDAKDDGAVRLARRTTVLTAQDGGSVSLPGPTTVPRANDMGGRGGRRGRGCSRLIAEGCGDPRDGH
jgi:hypothetical protein